MCAGMVPNFVALSEDPLHEVRVFRGVLSDQEKGRLNPSLLKDVQQPRGVLRTWPIVKGHCDVLAVNVAGAIRCGLSSRSSDRSFVTVHGPRVEKRQDKNRSDKHLS